MSRESSRPDRRAVLKGSGLAAAAPVLLPAAPALPMALVLPDVEVAGVGYHATPEILKAMARGLRVVLRREAHNGHDPSAVAIHLTTGEKIGYVPRHSNVSIAGLLDAGHSLCGEITDTERREFETRLSGDGKPFPGRVILSEVDPDADGTRRVLMADVRPRFRAYLSTGHPDDAPLPDPDAIPDDPGWRRLAPEFEPCGAFGPVVEGESWPRRGDMLAIDPGGRWLKDGAGRQRGALEPEHIDLVARARRAGLSVKAVATRIREEAADEDSPAYRGLWVELRIDGVLPPPDPAEAQRAYDIRNDRMPASYYVEQRRIAEAEGEEDDLDAGDVPWRDWAEAGGHARPGAVAPPAPGMAEQEEPCGPAGSRRTKATAARLDGTEAEASGFGSEAEPPAADEQGAETRA